MKKRGSKIVIDTHDFMNRILIMLCVLTNLSQLPFFVDLGISSRFSVILWSVFGGLLLFSTKTINKRFLINIFIVILFYFFVGVNYIITKNDYWSSSHVYSLIIVVFVFCVGCSISNSIDDKFFCLLTWWYTISAVIVAITVYIKYFSVGFNISSRIYAYDSKNSFSQILITAIILLLFGLPHEKKHRFIKWILIVLLFFMICIMKSRASLLGFAVIYYFFLRSELVNGKAKTVSIIILLLAVYFVFSNTTIRNLVIRDILFAGRDAANLNDISSGRIGQLENAVRIIDNNLLFGIGAKYLDCFPVSVIMQFGLFAGIILCAIACLPMIYALFAIAHRKNNRFYYLLLILSLTYNVNGLFEALSPFGPGVKCYFLWLFYGILLNSKKWLAYEEDV